jgi:putative DNA primase/helicase
MPTMGMGMKLETTDTKFLESVPRYYESITEDQAGVAFARAYTGQLRYDERSRTWFTWSGFHWKETRDLAATELVRNFVRALSGRVSGRAKDSMGRAGFAERAERVAKTNPLILVDSDRWDANPLKLGTPGGTVDLRSGVLASADPADLITKLTCAAPSGGEDCPRWLQFLDEAMQGDAELIRFLKQFCGYSLTGVVREHVLAFAHGDGGNGKSTFVKVVGSILNDYATVAPMESLTETKAPRHETEIARLVGKRLVTASETTRGSHWNEARINNLTGGDRLTARFMSKNYFEFDPTHKLLVIGNYQPAFRGVNDAIRRRVRIIEFKHKPAQVDTSLSVKLLDEAPGIIRWMINGALDWNGKGLILPQSVRLATDDFLTRLDVLTPWLAENCEIYPAYKIKAGDLRKSWEEYANAVGYEYSPKDLSERLREKGFMVKRGGGGVWHYHGLRLAEHRYV